MKLSNIAAGLVVMTSVAGHTVRADDDDRRPIPHLDHVFVIVEENHGFGQIINNPNMPYFNKLIASKTVGLATNYFAIGHPSLTNYLEIVGASNFGVRSDNDPAWHNTSCVPNIETRIANADNAGGSAPTPIESGNICPISGSGLDARTEAVDNWNEVALPTFPYLANIDGSKAVPAATTEGKTIADQLVRAGYSWKSYQESLPVSGADLVNYSNGAASNLDASSYTGDTVTKAYASKHNPFVYFKNVQDGTDSDNSLKNVVGFDGHSGLFSDLATGKVPNYSFIVPNQCNDQHGRGGGADSFCQFDFGADAAGLTYGTQVGLNPGLIRNSDVALQKIVTSIKASPVWKEGHNAIVIVWDENDYSGNVSGAPFLPQNQNRVVLTVDTNYRKGPAVQSNVYYNHYSLVKTLEVGFGLPYLNHAADKDVSVMTELFAR